MTTFCLSFITEVVVAPSFKMEHVMKKVEIFNGKVDLTCLELKTWRSVLCCLVGANTAYYDQMSQAADILNMFRAYSAANVTGSMTGKNSHFAAGRMSAMVDRIAYFHKDVFGGFDRHYNPEGSFEEIFKSSDEEFQVLKKKSTALFNEHQKLENISENAWKKYLRKLRVKRKLEVILYRTMTLKQLRLDERMVRLDRKLDKLLSEYNQCFAQEISHREIFAEECRKVKDEFLEKESENLELMFSCINQSLDKLLILFPHGHRDDSSVSFLPERPIIRDLAEKTWNIYTKEHVFPEKKNPNCNPDESDDDEIDSDDDTRPVATEYKGFSKPREARVEERTCTRTCSRGREDEHTQIVGYIARHYVGCGDCRVDNKKRVTVYALQTREKTNSRELSIRSTMKIKQTKAANERGMAYGYKRTRRGFRKYGFYPADMVALECCFLNTLREL